MKKRTLFFLFIFLTGINEICHAQTQTNIDSLHRLLKTVKVDTVKVHILNDLSGGYCFIGEYDTARKYSAMALQLAEKANFMIGQVRAYLNTGVPYFYENKYDKALESYNAAMALSKKNNYRRGMIACYSNIGLVYTYQRKYTEALKLHQEALEWEKENHDSDGMAMSYNNIGIIYEDQGNYTEALKSYMNNLRISEAMNNKRAVADIYINIGNIYGLQENYFDALKYYQPALKVYKELNYKPGIAICYLTMADAYLTLDSLKLAMYYAQEAFVLCEENGNRVNAALAKCIIAQANSKLGNNQDALAGFTESLKFFYEIEDTLNIAVAYRGTGDTYVNMGKYDEALKNYTKGLEMATAVNYKTCVVYLYGAIAGTYEKKSDFKNAYLNHKLYFSLSDSLLNEKKTEQTAEMKARYETEKKDKDIALLNKDKEIQIVEIKKQKLLKYSYVGGLGLVIVLMLFGYRTYRTRQTLRLQDIRNKIAGDLHDDIGSTLNSISVYSEVARRKDEQQDEALEMIGEASRKIIDAMSDIVWTVNPENDSFPKILFRMKSLAYNLFRAKKIEYTFHADENLEQKKLPLEDRRNFYLIFKEAVNNMVKYSNATQASITLTSEDDRIRLLIRDNGVGFDMQQDSAGNGLKNMKRRAEEMNAKLTVESSTGNGTQIELILKA